MPIPTLLLIQSSSSIPLDQWLPLLIPLIILELILLVVALIDLIRRDPRQVRGGNKLVWVLVIVLISTFGPICYLLLGQSRIAVEINRGTTRPRSHACVCNVVKPAMSSGKRPASV